MSALSAVLPGVTPELETRLVEGLAAVNDRLGELVDHDDPFVHEASHHLVDAGGKRFRPLLTLLCAQLGTGTSREVVDAAAGVELTHLASLYHDDVMDEADVRRGVTSANAAYGNSVAILVGDLLFGKASEVVAGLGSEAVVVQARTFVRLCAGQIQDDRQTAPEGADDEERLQHYLQVLADKTGVLIATAARYGAMFSGCDESVTRLLEQYGELVGLVFQLSDDLLDVTSESEQSGKTPGTDLREGVVTLPVLYARRSTDAADARLLELLDADLTDDALHAEALGLLRAHRAMDQAREKTLDVARRAAALLDPLPESDAKAALQGLPVALAGRAS